MRKTLVILGIATIACGTAMADQVSFKKILVTNVQVMDVASCRVTYEMSGRSLEKPIRDLDFINLDGQRDFNKAEELMKAGKASEAVVEYDKADKAETVKPWQKRLIRYRRLLALDAANVTGRAVEDWLAIVDENALARPAVNMGPKGMAAKGSPENAKAIKLLEARLKGAKDASFLAKLKELLTDLYTTEGLDAKLAALNGAAGTAATEPSVAAPGTTATPAAGIGTGTTVEPAAALPRMTSAAMADQLQSVATQIKAGQFEAAAEAVKARLRQYSAEELPNALMLRGKALMGAYDKAATKDPQMLLDAGVCFMRVATSLEQTHALVPEAMFLSGQVCEKLGNRAGAMNAYRMIGEDLREKFPDWGKKADAAFQAASKAPAAAPPAAPPASAPAAPAAPAPVGK